MRAWLSSCLLWLAACTGPTSPGGGATSSASGWTGPGDTGSTADIGLPFADATPTTTDFLASTADPQATGSAVQWAAWTTGPVPSGRLVVLLPDAGHVASDYHALLQTAAAYGHRVLVLAGPWQTDVNALCGVDAGCLESVRLEMLDGQEHTKQVTVATPDGLETRLLRALQWLSQHVPQAGWAPFLANSQPVWPSLVLVGHGQGGAMAMMAAAKHSVARVGLLAAPHDADGQGAAPWLATHATSSSVMAGLCHSQDPDFAAVAQAWTALGLGGTTDHVDIDLSPPPYFGLRAMTSSAHCDQPADCIAFDSRYRDVWRALVGKPF